MTSATAPASFLMPEDPVCSYVRSFLVDAASQGNADLAYGIEDETLRECVYYEYPARMVSRLQGDLLDAYLKAHPEATTVADPFMGSGTILAETMSRGLRFIGQDLNPLSLLLGRLQAGPFFPVALQRKAAELALRAKGIASPSIPDFRGRDKWFAPKVVIDLARLHDAVMGEPQPWARRFFWVALAETARLTSNSRTSTYKLHIRKPGKLQDRSVSAPDVFWKVVDRNLARYKARTSVLTDAGLLNRGHYTNHVHLRTENTQRTLALPQGVLADIVMTSPPYGDNRTTVPYGQHSYLPLQWINWDDVHPSLDQSINETAYRLDAASLGGQNAVTAADMEWFRQRSNEIDRLCRALRTAPPDRTKRIVSFARDLDEAIAVIDQGVKPGGYLFWTLGNRTVGGQNVAIDKMVPELSTQHEHVLTVTRRIPRKRMAARNAISATMQAETIVVMRKPEA